MSRANMCTVVVFDDLVYSMKLRDIDEKTRAALCRLFFDKNASPLLIFGLGGTGKVGHLNQYRD